MTRSRLVVVRLLSATAAVALLAGALIAGAGTASATTSVSTKTLLASLPTASEHRGGYSAAAFGSWSDADGDGCVTSREVMIRDALDAPQVASGCTLSGGRWKSRYDGKRVTDSAQLR